MILLKNSIGLLYWMTPLDDSIRIINRESYIIIKYACIICIYYKVPAKSTRNFLCFPTDFQLFQLAYIEDLPALGEEF